VPAIDHLVHATPDLDATVAAFARSTGVVPEVGGSHQGLGTRNALVSLGSCYLELIGPDPDQPAPGRPRPFGIDDLDAPAFVAFAVRPSAGDTIERLARSAADAGTDPGDIVAMSRTRPDGVELRWRLTFPHPDRGPGVPFLIDWGDTPMPSDSIRPRADLTDVCIVDPDPADVGALVAALGLDIDVEIGSAPTLRVGIEGPDGPFPG